MRNAHRLRKTIVFAILFAVLNVAFAYEMHINCGGDSVDIDGTLYLPDMQFGFAGAGYVGGHSIPAGWGIWQIGGTHCHPLYMGYREGFNAYAFLVPPGGYMIKLKMCESQHHGPGRRIMDVVAEDTVILRDLDLYAEIGKDYAYEMALWVQCDDGTLAVRMPSSIGEPLLAAISVKSRAPETTAPPSPDHIFSANGYNNTIIYWHEMDISDIRGYIVQRRNAGGGSWTTLTSRPTPLRRFIDKTATVGTNYEYRVAAVDVFGNAGPWSSPSSAVHAMNPTESALPVYELFVDSTQLAILADDPWSDDYVVGSFSFGAASWPDIEVRHRGNVSRGVSKKNWKIKFPSDDLFEDERKLNLNSEFQDRSLLKNHYGFNLYRWADVQAPYADYAHLELNDEYYGVYVRLEQVDEAYLRHRGLSETDPIYKSVWFAFYVMDDYSFNWERETDCGWGDLEDIIELLNETPDEHFEAMMDSAFDVEGLLRYYAVVNLTSDDDFSIHNLYLHRNTATGIWNLIPWDHNVAFDNPRSPLDLGTHFSPQTIGGANVLLTRTIMVDTFRERYCDLLDSLSTTLFAFSSVGDYVDSVASLIQTDVYADYRKNSYENNQGWEESIGHMGWFMNERVAFVRPGIDSLRAMPNPKGIYINEICAVNDSCYADDYGEYDDWLELYNANSYSVNIEGMYLTDDLEELMVWEFPSQAIAAHSFLVLWLDGDTDQGPLHGPFNLDGGGEFVGLFDITEGPEPWWEPTPPAIDLLWFGEQSADISWGRYPDGEDNWGYAGPTPGTANAVTVANEQFVSLPEKLEIESIYPNPFNSRCKIVWEASSDADLSVGAHGRAPLQIEVFDLTGRIVRRISVGDGMQSTIWDGRDDIGRPLASGVYLARIRSGDRFSETRRVVLVK